MSEPINPFFWSPDSQYIGFVTQGKLRKIPVAGGPVQVLCDVPAAPSVIGATWSRDGVILFAQVPVGLFRVSDAGGAPAQVMKGGENGIPMLPQFLPDNRHFLYSLSGNPEKAGIYVGSLDGQTGDRLLSDVTNPVYAPAISLDGIVRRDGYLVFARDGTLMAQPFDPSRLALTGAALPVAEGVAQQGSSGFAFFSSAGTALSYFPYSPPPPTQLIWKDRMGRSTGTFGPPGTYNNFRLSPDNTRITFDAVQDGNQDVWVLDSGRGVASRMTFESAVDFLPMWSPDGLRVVWTSGQGGKGLDLHIKSAYGTGQEALLVPLGTPNGRVTDWSRDRRYLMYQRPGDETGHDLWVAPQLPEGGRGDKKPHPYLQSPFEELEGRFSPDGRWVAYVSNESGRNEIYVQSFPLSGEKFQISRMGGQEVQWRPDGTELFYIATDQMLMAVPVKVGRASESFQAGSARPLFPLPSQGNLARSFAVGNDGQRFLVPSVQGSVEPPPLTVVVNWQAGFSRK
jgi:Tol biopolymer transport system component